LTTPPGPAHFYWLVGCVRNLKEAKKMSAIEAAASNGAKPAVFAAPPLRNPENQTARLAWPNAHRRARSTGGDRPSGTDMNRVAAARTTGCYRKSVPGTTKHTGCSRTHTHEHRGLWREIWVAREGGAGGWVRRRRRYSERRRPRGTGRRLRFFFKCSIASKKKIEACLSLA
jgi:hypothetical protein